MAFSRNLYINFQSTWDFSHLYHHLYFRLQRYLFRNNYYGSYLGKFAAIKILALTILCIFGYDIKLYPMEKKIYFFLTVLLIITSCSKNSMEQSKTEKTYAEYDLSMYPKANDSMKRFVIKLPIEENEGLFNLEIWTGKTQKVDCNKHSLSGKFIQKTVKGWGYSYYEFSTSGHIMSTQMACPETGLKEQFIRSKTEYVRYNSKLPIVVYCPKNLEVEYAVWSKNKTPIKAHTE